MLQQGRMIEQGSHDALLAQNGEYARLFRLQASWTVPYAPEGNAGDD
jgi:ABC-type transport system involved in cytochrome bd biosynthesis fused ATPase/permease subunit